MGPKTASPLNTRKISLFSCCLLLLSNPVFGQKETAPPGVTQPLNEMRRTTLKGNTHPLALPLFDLGTASADLPMERMLLVLRRSHEQEITLQQFLSDQQTTGLPRIIIGG